MNSPKILLLGALFIAGISLSFVTNAQGDDFRSFEAMIESLSSKKSIAHPYRVTTTVTVAGNSQQYCGEGAISVKGNRLNGSATPQAPCRPNATPSHQLDIKLYVSDVGNLVVMVHSTEDDWTRRLQNIQMKSGAGEMVIEGQYLQSGVEEHYRIAIPVPNMMASRN